MKHILIIVSFILGCGKPQTTIDPEFEGYVQNFEAETGFKVNITIRFAKQNGNVVGVCYKYDDNSEAYVEIDPDFWQNVGKTSKVKELREELIYHELGHCILNQGHREDLTAHPSIPFPFPNSIMYPYIIGGQNFYKTFRSHYVQELLTPGKRLEL